MAFYSKDSCNCVGMMKNNEILCIMKLKNILDLAVQHLMLQGVQWSLLTPDINASMVDFEGIFARSLVFVVKDKFNQKCQASIHALGCKMMMIEITSQP